MVRPDEFLRLFHSRRGGRTPLGFAAGRDDRGHSSYQRLLERPPARWLDLGCGDGYLLSLAQGGIGIDFSPAEVRAARLRGAPVALADARALPFPAKSFDAIYSHLAFTLMSDIEGVVAEIRRTLRPGGVFRAVVGGGPKVDSSFEIFLDIASDALGQRRVPRLGTSAARTDAGLRALFADGFGEVAIEDFWVDIPPAREWDLFASQYELWPLSPGELRALRARFHKVRPDSARCRCAMRLVEVSEPQS
jgi:SAM-dependent methyltransferase